MLITLKDFAKNPLTIISLKPKHVKINYTVNYSPICYLYLWNTKKYKGKIKKKVFNVTEHVYLPIIWFKYYFDVIAYSFETSH